MKEKINLITSLLCLVKEMLINFNNLNDDIKNNYDICQKICYQVIQRTHIDLNIINHKNIPVDSNFLLVSNHRSFFDILLLLSTIGQPLGFVAAQELYNIPILKTYMNSLECIAVDRNTESRTKIKKQLNDIYTYLAKKNLILFPEGQCNYANDELLKFKKGCFTKLRDLNIFIVPTYININSFSHIGKWYVPKNKVDISFGEPFRPLDINEKPTTSELVDYTRKKIIDLK